MIFKRYLRKGDFLHKIDERGLIYHINGIMKAHPRLHWVAHPVCPLLVDESIVENGLNKGSGNTGGHNRSIFNKQVMLPYFMAR